MRKIILLGLMLILTLIGYQSSLAQKKRDANKHLPVNVPAPIPVSPVLPIEVKIGLHRYERAIFLTIKNQHPNLAISELMCNVYVYDSLKGNIAAHYLRLNFRFPLAVEPGKTGEAVITKSDDISIGQDWTPALCLNYEISTRLAKNLDEKATFAPAECRKDSDMLIVVIRTIEYKDGSEWVSNE